MQKLVGNLKMGIVFILSAPAGTGKTTLVRMLSQEFPCIVESVSCTTRPARLNEVDGEDYHFLTPEAFKEKISQGDFLEFASVFGYNYGTSKTYVQKQKEKGHHVFLVIDTQGALQLRKMDFPGVYVFLSPPSLEELKARLLRRKTDPIDVIEKRLSWAEKEMGMISHYDYHIVNDHLDQAYVILRSIVIAEEHKIRSLKA